MARGKGPIGRLRLEPSRATMRAMHDLRRRLAGLSAASLILVALAAPAAVLAHAMLESATPAVGSTVETSPPVVSATFDDDLEASKSSIEVVGPDGATIAKGGVLADDPKTLSVDVPLLAAATYDVRWAAASEDGHIERGQYQFAVAARQPWTDRDSRIELRDVGASTSSAASPASAYTPPGSAPPSASPEPGDTVVARSRPDRSWSSPSSDSASASVSAGGAAVGRDESDACVTSRPRAHRWLSLVACWPSPSPCWPVTTVAWSPPASSSMSVRPGRRA